MEAPAATIASGAALSKTIAQRWSAYWFEPISARPICAFRILYGTYLLIYFLGFATRVELLLSSDGVPASLAILPEQAPALATAWILYGATLIACLLFTIGYRPRLVTPVLLLLYVHHFIVTGGFFSYDRINLIFLAVLCGADLDGYWSVRPSRRATTPAWATRLIRLEIALMYFGSGLVKLLNPDWHDGKLLQMSWIGSWGTPLSFWVVQHGWPSALYDVLSWGVIAFELGLGFALFHRRTRWPAAVAGTLFHAANWALLGIPEFMNCACTYALFLVPSNPGVPSDSARRSVIR